MSTFLTPAPINGATTSTLSGIAIDNASGFLYYFMNDGAATATLDELRRTPLSGASETTLTSNVAASPGAMVVDQANNRILAIDVRNNQPKIVAISLTNSAVSTFLTPAPINGATTSTLSGIAIAGPSPTTVTSINRIDANPTNLSSVTYNVVFAASVTGLSPSNFSLTPSGINGAVVSNVSGSGTSYTVTVNTGSGSGSLTLNLANSTGISPNVSNIPFTGQAFTIDKTAPTVTSVNVPANGLYRASQTLSFTVNFTENVSVTGTPQLGLTIGSTGRQATYTGGSGSSSLTFTYTIQAGELDTDGIVLNALSLNSGTIRDAVGNNATLTLNGVGSTAGVLVDAIIPTVSSVGVPPNGNYRSGQALSFVVNFTENVTVTGTPQLGLTIGSTNRQANYVVGSGTSALTFAYTVQPGELDTDGISLNTLSVNDGTIRDAAGNNATLTLNSIGSTANVRVDAVPPTVSISSSAITNGATTSTSPLPFTLTFSESVTGLASNEISVTNATLSDFSGSGSIYTFTVVPSASGQVTINVVTNVAEDVAGNGNSASNTYSFTYQAAPTITNFVATNPTICAGQVVGFTATLGNVGSGYTYTLSDGTNAISGNGTGTSFSQSLTVNTSGPRTFTLAITSNGQSNQASTLVTVSTPPTNASLTGGILSCSQPSVTISATADGASSYSFSTGASQIGSTNQAVVSQVGTYTVIISNAQGCTVAQTTTITSNTAAPVVTLSASGTLTCTQNSVTLTADGGNSYVFNGPSVLSQTGNQAIVNIGGLYSVTATGPNGCTATQTTTVFANTAVTPINLTASNPLSCLNSSVTLTATSGFTSYSFSTGATQQGSSNSNTATVNTPGTYSVTATNASGCQSTTNVTVTGSTTSSPISLNASGTLSCSNPSVTLTATAGFTSYSFSTGATQQGSSNSNTATVNTAGTYSVTAINASGCQSTTNITVMGSTTATSVTLTASGPLSCSVSTATLTATPGFSSYIFSSGATQQGGSTSNIATVSTTGIYSVTAVNASGCQSITTVTVGGSTTATPVNLISNGTLSCSNPSVTLTATAGFTSYVFSAGATQQGSSLSNTATVTTAGFYSVTAVNASGCQSTTNVTVVGSTTATPVNLNASGTLSCSNPSVTLTATSGFTSYSFSTGATQQGSSSANTATVNLAGIYSVSAINASGCLSTTSVTVAGSTTATPVTLTTSGTLSCSNSSVTLTATSGFTSYAFSSGATQQGNGATNTATVTTSGTYSVTATNASGCQSTTNVTVTGSTTSSPISLNASGTLSCSNPSVTLTATAGFTSYSFSTGATQQGSSNSNTATVNTAGTYSVTAINASGCQSTTNITVMGSTTATSVTLTASGPLSCSVSTATLTATPGFTSYIFSSGAIQQGSSAANTATVSTTGIYSVTAVNASGCRSFASVTVGYQNCNPTSNFAITNVTLLSCSPVAPNRRSISFTPVYSGLTGQPISFSIVNELAPTTQTGPYQLNLYTDNPVIVLKATQQGTPGEVTFNYSWLTACMGMTAPNTPPSVVVPIPAQSATVNQTFSLEIPAGTFTDAETPSSLTYSVIGLPPGIGFYAPNFISGTPSTSIGTPFSVTVIATDPGGLAARTIFQFTVSPASTTATFGITGVNLVNCTTLSPNRRSISFNPVYSGATGQPITFSVVNELFPTTAAGPYQLNLYTDNPVIILKAIQQNTPGEVSFSYNWLTACNGTPSTNTPPTVANPIGAQSATINQGYSFTIPGNTFADTETPSSLVLSVSGLPAGLGFTPPATISGTPSTSIGSPYSVTVTATDPGGLSARTSFSLVVNPPGSTTSPGGSFAITGATLVSCTSLSPNRKSIRFTPVYSGLNGQPISFSVVNELLPTTSSGPYQLDLYTDNPVILLKATQQGTSSEATFNYNWLNACSAMGRQGVSELPLQVVVLGNPVINEQVEVLVKGAQRNTLTLRLVNVQNRPLHEQTIEQAGTEERVNVRVGSVSGIYLLEVQIPGQRQVIKIVKP
ncbi:hypothetical protein GCM10028807_38540 [Spirosoma daeguense]